MSIESDITSKALSGQKLNAAEQKWVLAQPCKFTPEEAQLFGDRARQRLGPASAREYVANVCAIRGITEVVGKHWGGTPSSTPSSSAPGFGSTMPWGWIGLAAAVGLGVFLLTRARA